MTWESDVDDSTRALSVYTKLRDGLTTRTAIHDALQTFWQAHQEGGYPALSTAYTTDGTAFLVSAGLVTLSTDTITPVHTVGGQPAPIRRVPGNDFALELVP